MARLHELFTTECKVALTGIGGVGKTRLAVRYAYLHQQNYDYIFWVSASSQSMLLDGFASLADQLKANPVLKQAEKIAFFKSWLEQHSHWLLIFDNADNIEEMTHEVFQALLPVAPSGKILFTTQIATKNFTRTLLPINCLDKQTGSRFLWQRIDANKQPTTREITDAEEISQQLAGLPLALAQAAAYIETNQCALPEYVSLYQDYAKALLNPEPDEHQQSIPDHSPVFATFKLSFSRLPEKSQNLLSFCAMLHADAIPEELLTTAFELDVFSLNEVLRPMLRYGLMLRNAEDKTLSLHRLVQRVLQLDRDEAQQQTLVEQAISVLNTLLPRGVEFKDWHLYERLLVSSLACARCVMELSISNTEAGLLLNEIAVYLNQAKADYSQAERLMLKSLAIYEQVLGKDHPKVASVLNNLAALYDEQGKYTEAEPLYQRSLAIWEQALGKDHPDVATSLNNLALLYCNQGKYTEAKPLYQRSLAIWKQALGKDHPNVAQSLNNLAQLYDNQGKYTKAESLYQRSLAILEQALDKDHPVVALSLNNLAGLYFKQDKLEAAEPLFKRSLAIRETALGKDHPDIALSLLWLARLYQKQGKTKEVEALFKRSLAIRETALGNDHPDIAQSLWWLARLYQKQGKTKEAETLFKRSLAIYEQALGKDHPYTQSCREQYQNLLTAM